MVDYSKWDKLELSDDSDIEVHPNVDKTSFIRWKQRDIHEKREQSKFRTLQLEVNIETNEDLLIRVRRLIEAGEKGHKVGVDVDGDVKLSQAGDTKTKPEKATSAEQPLYPDMIESMLMQIVAEDGNPAVVLNKLREHEDMIKGALKEEQKELNKLEEERRLHITTDDIRTGWDSTIVYKAKDDAAKATSEENGSNESKANSSSETNSVKSLETLNSPALVSQKEQTKAKVDEDGLEELLPATKEFGEIPIDKLDLAFNFLMRHPFIVNEGQKDALLMTAFELEFAGNTKQARQIVWNSLLIQYSSVLGKDGVRLFFSKIVKKDHPARGAFEQDVDITYNHINSRCKILNAENGGKGFGNGNEEDVETIQLHAVDPDTELTIRVPEEGMPGRELYDGLSSEVKRAIETHELDKINEVLATLSVDDAEDLVGKLSESGVLQVENKIYERQEWEDKKEQMQPSTHDDNTSRIQEVQSSVDELD